MFWSYVVQHAAFLINRIPSPVLHDKSPFELMYRKVPDLNELKPFSCLCYAAIVVARRHKFDTRSRKSVFIGFKSGVRGFVLVNLDTREVFISRHVKFYEQRLPYGNKSDDHIFHLNSFIPFDSQSKDNIAPSCTITKNVSSSEPSPILLILFTI